MLEESAGLLFRGVIRCRNLLRRSRRDVHILSRLGITHLFASFLFDRRLIGFQTLNLLRVPVVFLLDLIDALAQGPATRRASACK